MIYEFLHHAHKDDCKFDDPRSFFKPLRNNNQSNHAPSTGTGINTQISIFLKSFLSPFLSRKYTSEDVSIHVPPIKNDRDRLLFVFPQPFLSNLQ